MKKTTKVLGLVALVVAVFTFNAYAEIPKTINLQSVVYDQDGNVTDKEFVSVSVQIVDEAGNVYFQEDNYDIPVVQGAMNLVVGESLGGIPINALDPNTGRKFVNVLIDGSNPYDILPLSSVPYALWADTAVGVVDDSIDGDSIKEGSIELRHLSSDFNIDQIGGEVSNDQIPDNIIRQETFDVHLNSTTAHEASSLSLNPGGAFAAQLGATVQVALETLYSNYAQEVASRQTAIASLNTQLTNSVNNLQGQITSNDGDIASLNSTVSNHTGRINTLESNVSSLTTTAGQHETRIDALEGQAPPDSRSMAYAWGAVDGSGNRLYGYRFGSSSSSGGVFPVYRVNFETAAANDNVVVILTIVSAALNSATTIRSTNVSRSGFDVTCSYPNDGFPPSLINTSCGFHWLAFANQ